MTPCSAVRDLVEKAKIAAEHGAASYLTLSAIRGMTEEALSLPQCREGELREANEKAERMVRGVFADYRRRACAKTNCQDSICADQMRRLALDEANILDALSSPPRSPEEAKPKTIGDLCHKCRNRENVWRGDHEWVHGSMPPVRCEASDLRDDVYGKVPRGYNPAYPPEEAK